MDKIKIPRDCTRGRDIKCSLNWEGQRVRV